MTHDELIKHAKQWLLSAKQCNPVFTEKGSAKTGEMPDVIGWCSAGSIIVECKTSISDFRADKKKEFRINPRKGMGLFRFFFTTQILYNIIPKREWPEGWGRVVIDELTNRVSQVRCKWSKEWMFDKNAEIYFFCEIEFMKYRISEDKQKTINENKNYEKLIGKSRNEKFLFCQSS